MWIASAFPDGQPPPFIPFLYCTLAWTRLVSAFTRTIGIHLSDDADRSYSVVIGSGVLASIGALLHPPSNEACGDRRAIIVADSAVLTSHAARVEASLQAAGIGVTVLPVVAGEASKSVTEATRLWNELARLAVDRQTQIVAVGGGVIGDLAAFVAATFARGLPVWHVPTTLVAQVDSAIGGKTGVNLAAGKNLVGAFWQPRGVVADISTLDTLPDREFHSGLAEVIKYGMILDADFFSWLEANTQPILARDANAIVHLVDRCVSLKAHVVQRDEQERYGLRVVLNYGHTFAHALETAAGYGVLLHGEAVAIGMACALRLAEKMGRVDAVLVARQDRLLAAFNLPSHGRALAPAALKAFASNDLLAIMARDKKTRAGRLQFVLPSGLGRAELVENVETAWVHDVLEATCRPC